MKPEETVGNSRKQEETGGNSRKPEETGGNRRKQEETGGNSNIYIGLGCRAPYKRSCKKDLSS